MAGFHFSLPDTEKRLFRDSATRWRERMARAVQLAKSNIVFNIKKKGDADILSSGKFTRRWTDAFTVASEPPTGVISDRYVISVYFNSSIPYAHVHEFGANIKAKGTLFGPAMLWIPLSFGNVPQSGGGPNAGKMTAQEYGGSVSKLFRVNRKGKAPLLLDIKAGRPRYFGIRAVRLKQRFHIRKIGRNEAKTFQTKFNALIGKGK